MVLLRKLVGVKMNEMRLEMRTGIALQIHVEIYKFFIYIYIYTYFVILRQVEQTTEGFTSVPLKLNKLL